MRQLPRRLPGRCHSTGSQRGDGRIVRKTIRVRQTIATITAEDRFIAVAEREILRQRAELEAYIRCDPRFGRSLEPCAVRRGAPEIARRMAEAAARVGVGPMAAVAGAIAEYAVRAMVEAGARHAIVDNGGDIALILDRPVILALYTGRDVPLDLGLHLQPRSHLFGVCTSSATVGHSLSFGRADAATVIAGDVVLADAAATALGNRLTRPHAPTIRSALNSLLLDGIDCLIAVVGRRIGWCGDLPDLVRVDLPWHRITKA
jgi:hypothetical protein